MTRIISGSARGRELKVPKSGTRPTSDRVRESIFTALDHRMGGFSGAKVLDLFSGSGAFALEALSRGAESATCVESARSAAQVISTNAANLGFPAKVVCEDALKYVARPAGGGFDLVFADPPYEMATEVLTQLVKDLKAGGWLAEGAWLVIERSDRSAPLPEPDGAESYEYRKYGETGVWLVGW